MSTIHIVMCGFNDIGFRPINWEQFQKLDQGKAIINDSDFEFFTAEGEKMSGTLSLSEVIDTKDWYAKEYIANFTDTGLNCFLSLSWQKLDKVLSTKSNLQMHCLVDPNFWYFYASIVK